MNDFDDYLKQRKRETTKKPRGLTLGFFVKMIKRMLHAAASFCTNFLLNDWKVFFGF
ncbi:hypothetical protein N786_16950 [Bacillus amyloliquefaciens UASWS BA1]|nr:hypothetical protein N786_16950 [Bacillus amyloliquefaciens UASWS BA1]